MSDDVHSLSFRAFAFQVGNHVITPSGWCGQINGIRVAGGKVLFTVEEHKGNRTDSFFMEDLRRRIPGSGGKRLGAGRKPLPLDQRAVGITMRVRPAIAARFAAWCTLRGVSQSRAFSEWVKRSARESPRGL